MGAGRGATRVLLHQSQAPNVPTDEGPLSAGRDPRSQQERRRGIFWIPGGRFVWTELIVECHGGIIITG